MMVNLQSDWFKIAFFFIIISIKSVYKRPGIPISVRDDHRIIAHFLLSSPQFALPVFLNWSYVEIPEHITFIK